MANVPRYWIQANAAFLPSGPQGAGTYHSSNTEVTYEGEPNLNWLPMNEEAAAAQRALGAKLIARQRDTIKTLSPATKSMAMHRERLLALEKAVKAIHVSAPPPAPEVLEAKAQSMYEIQMAGGYRPSDDNSRGQGK